MKKEEREREYDVIKKYLSATAPMWRNVELQDVWRVDREGEVRRVREGGGGGGGGGGRDRGKERKKG